MRSLALLLFATGCGTEKLESPEPALDAVDPGLVCVDQLTTPVTVTGSGLTPLPTDVLAQPVALVLPELALQLVSQVDGSDGAGGPVVLDATWTDAQTMGFTVTPELALPPGVYDLTVTNADGASATLPGAFVGVPEPTLVSVEPALVCGDAPEGTLLLSGEGFVVVDGQLPTVTIGSGFSRAADRSTGCVEVTAGVETCTGLEVDVVAGDLATGLHSVVVTNPEPAACGSTAAVELEVVAAPVIAALTPASTCTSSGDVELVVEGSGFLEVGGTLPTVTIGGEVFSATVGACAPLAGSVAGSVCDTLTVAVPAGSFPTAGSYDVVVTNPAPADCASVAATWEVASPPVITEIEPDATCDDGETITVRGEAFTPFTQVTVGGVETTETYVSDTELAVTLPPAMGAGVYDVTVSNGAGCDDTLPGALTLAGLPYVFYVDPPVVWDAVPIRATVYVSGINGGVVDAWLENAVDGTITPVAFDYDPADAGVVLVDVPQGLPEGSYHLHLADGYTCEPVLTDAVFVESDLTLTLSAIEPAFGWTADTTSTRITASGGLLDVPRVYLSPVVQGPDSFATELRGVSLADPTTIDAVVPAGLPLGTYDVLVVNPDGQIGVLLGGFEVVANQPPLVTSISPGSLPNDGIYPIFVQGAGFLGSGLAAPTVVADCVDPDSGLTEQVVATVTAWDATSIEADFDADLGIGTGICVFTITNDDGTTGVYSALSVTNPSQNLYAWRAAPPMTTPRRAPVAVAGRVTPTQRYLYAVGGDDGLGTTWDTIEAAQVDLYGGLGGWSLLPVGLPEPRAFAGSARVGRYLYVVGGTDGVTAQPTALRAQILDPLEAPTFSSSLAFELGTGVELPVGTYVYRVSALFAPDDDENPGGESLPSDPFVVRVPDVPERIAITLSWDPVPGAVGYRLYRSDTGSGSEALLLETAVPMARDVGGVTDPAVVPLPPGSVGRWAALPEMASAREGACVAVAPDPADPDRWWLVAAGGRDDAGVVRGDIELLPLTVVGEHDQDAGVWQTSAFALSTPRWQCGAFVATDELHSKVLAGDSWMYFGAGLTGAGAISTDVDALLVGSGDFDAAYAVSDMKQRAGYVYASANNFLYALGGSNGAPDASGESTELCAPGDAGCKGAIPDPPELGNWNALGGGTLLVDRYLAGSAQESSVIFAVGGETAADPATTSVEYTNY